MGVLLSLVSVGLTATDRTAAMFLAGESDSGRPEIAMLPELTYLSRLLLIRIGTRANVSPPLKTKPFSVYSPYLI